MNKIKIAVVVQRYGLEVNGGSEAYARILAERLLKYYDVEVLTTCAVNYVDWANEYEEGIDTINDVMVRRFPVDTKRITENFDKLTQNIVSNKHTYFDEINWMYAQGPQSNKMIEYIKNNHQKYDKVIFMTYLYFTTYIGMQLIPYKSILIPTAHDEFTIYFDIFRSFFNLPISIIYNAIEEKKLVNKLFCNDYINSDIVGIGIDKPIFDSTKSFFVKDEYIIYVGRIDESKGCKELFDYFIRFKNLHKTELKLVLVGKNNMDIPKHKDIIEAGFLSDEDKFIGIKNSRLLVLCSKYESLSLVVLESFYLGRPVLVNAKCEVLKGHCLRSNAGLYYSNYFEFGLALNLLISNDEINCKIGFNGIKYVEENYSWTVIDGKFREIIEYDRSNFFN